MNGKRRTMSKDSIAHYGRLAHLARWAVPGIVFSVAFGFAACTGTKNPIDPGCPTDTGSGGTGGSAGNGGSGAAMTSSGQGGAGGTTTSTTTTGTAGAGAIGDPNASGNEDNTFDHFNDPGDPFDILKKQQEEGPPEIRGRLHSCSKVSYSAIGEFLESRGVAIKTPPMDPKSAGQLYKQGKESLGVANYDAREAEAYFHTTAGATKLFDIFVQAAPEVIANIDKMPDCQLGGVGKPMFDAVTGECVFESLSCLMGRPAKAEDLKLCNTMIQHAAPGNQADLTIKRNITVAAFLSAAHTCE